MVADAPSVCTPMVDACGPEVTILTQSDIVRLA